jgi:cell wall-associated NlpC family hydrolase
MAGGRPHRQRLTAALIIALCSATPLAIAQPLLQTGGADATGPSASARTLTAQDLRAAAQLEVDAVSARLASLRTGLTPDVAPEERAVLEREEARLQRRKDALVRRLTRAEGAVADAVAADAERDRAERDASRRAVGAADPSPTATEGRQAITLGAAAVSPGLTTAAATGVPTGAGAADAATIDAYLAGKASPLAGFGAVFVTEAAQVGLDPRFLVAISGAETSFGTYGPSQAIHNPFGLGPHMVFASWPEAIRKAAVNLAGPLYRGDGRVTIPAIQQRWAPIGASNDPTALNTNWVGNVGRYYAEQGGDPAAPVFTGAEASLLPATALAPLAGTAGPPAAETALGLLGAPNAADADDGLDDAGLVSAAYGSHGVTLPEDIRGLATLGTPVRPMELRAGDAVFFSDASGRLVHVGMYLGAGQFVHAPGPGDVVGIASLYDAPWSSSYTAARRY